MIQTFRSAKKISLLPCFICYILMASLVADGPMVSSVSEEKDVVVDAVRVSYYLDRKLTKILANVSEKFKI